MVSLGIESITVALGKAQYKMRICSKSDWDVIMPGKASPRLAVKLVCGAKPLFRDVGRLFELYREALSRFREDAELTIPQYKCDDSNDIKYTVYTVADKLVADYAGLDIYRVSDIPIVDYWLLLRDAFISAASQTEKGRKYLKNAYRLEQTDADGELEG